MYAMSRALLQIDNRSSNFYCHGVTERTEDFFSAVGATYLQNPIRRHFQAPSERHILIIHTTMPLLRSFWISRDGKLHRCRTYGAVSGGSRVELLLFDHLHGHVLLDCCWL